MTAITEEMASPHDGGEAGTPPAEGGSGRLGPPSWLALGFLLPAILLLGALVVYPIIYTAIRSFFDATGKDGGHSPAQQSETGRGGVAASAQRRFAVEWPVWRWRL